VEQANLGGDDWHVEPRVLLRHALCIAHAVVLPVLFVILESLVGRVAVNQWPRALFWVGSAVFWSWIGWAFACFSPRIRQGLNLGVVFVAGFAWAVQVPVAFMTTLLVMFGPG
jgi:hypothetical protein